MGPEGTIYLLHFERPFKHAKHYLGWTGRGLDSRLAYHLNGHGSRLMRAVSRAGIEVKVARLWDGSRTEERRLHKRGGSAARCPICIRRRILTKLDATRLATRLRRAGFEVVGIDRRKHYAPRLRGSQWWVKYRDPETGRVLRIGRTDDPRIPA